MDKKSSNKKPKTVKDEWILCTSKKREGLKYLFNTATGESKWCTKDETSTKPPSPKKPRTPAQDRLKRLQKEVRAKKPIVEKTQKKTTQAQATTTNTSQVLTNDVKRQQKTEEHSKKDESSLKRKRKDVQPLQALPDSTKEVPEKKVKPEKNQSTIKKVLNNIKHLESEVRQKIVKQIGTLVQKPNDVKTPKLNGENGKLLQKFTIPKVALPDRPMDIGNVETAVINSEAIITTTTSLPALPVKPMDISETAVINDKAITTTTRTLPEHKGIANQRLEQLRNELRAQLRQTNSIVEHKIALHISKDNNNEEEPMDWEPVDAVETKPEKPTNGYYDKKRINESLLYFANEQRSKSKQKWRKDFYYIIPDTNVWLDHLAFLDELSKMKLLDTEGSVLYIPYIVIKELDGLKNRENVELRAKRAIHFIHEQMKSNNCHLQTQSAAEEKEKLINVDCADDSIINCCLQVQRHINHTMLLSEDTNLRNKAKCNDVFASTKSDLLSYH